jgi:PAS domain S-box-containing protein
MGKGQEITEIMIGQEDVGPEMNGAVDAGSERQFHAMLDAFPGAVYTTDAEGRLTYFNQAAVKFSGRVPELGTDKWCVSWKLFHPDGSPMPHDECPMAMAIKERRPILDQEAIAELPDGTRKWFAPFPVPLFGDDGELIGGINMLIDITEKKQAERNRIESEMLLSMAMQSSRMGAWERDLATETVKWSPELEEIFGLEPGSFDGTKHHFLDLVHEHDREMVRTEVERAIHQKRSYTIEFRFRHGDGNVRWMEGRGQAVYSENGEPIRLYGIGIDITDRKNAEEVMAKTAAIVESSDDAIISKDLNGIITSWNGGAERLFGYTAQETINRPITILIPPDRLDEEPRILEQLRRGEKVDHFETVRVRKDGSTLDLSLTISPVKDSHGRIIGASKIARDITERKRAEKVLSQSHADLREKVEELARFNRAMVGRELRMIELKKEVNELCREQGLAERYPLDFEQDARTN